MMMLILIKILTVICVIASCATCDKLVHDAPVVNITHLGSIQGITGETYFTKRLIYQFLGINYAKPPSGELRFKPPEEQGPWQGVYMATKMRQRCPQIDLPYYPQPDFSELDMKEDIEDCLVVNVFSPSIKTESPMPVLFYVHGGSFYLGSAYDFLPGFLLEENIVLVVAQYRLGPLGFLSLNTTEIPGNMAVSDILLALKWVKSNIRYFGGDPSKITVEGQSAGAAIVSSLLISPLVEKGLFDKMIIQSGAVLGTWAIDNNPIRSARRLAELLRCPTDDLSEMAECLKRLPPRDLVKAHIQIVERNCSSGGMELGAFGLVVQGPGGYFEKDPRDEFVNGPRIDVPVMGGITRDEGTLGLSMFYKVRNLDKITDEGYLQRNLTKDLIHFVGHEDKHGLLTDAYQNVYFEQKPNLKDMYPGLVDISGLLMLKHPLFRILRSVSLRNAVFAYSFNFYGGVSPLRQSEPEWDKLYPFPAGVAHSDELGYLFPSRRHAYNRRELKMVQAMTKFWTNFIKFGCPVLPDDTVKWRLMSNAYGPYLRISEEMEERGNFYDEFSVVTREGFLPRDSSSSSNVTSSGVEGYREVSSE